MSHDVPPFMTCKELVELVTDYLEGRMPLAQRTELEQHLVWCPPCQTYIRQMRTTIEIAGRITEDDLSEKAQAELSGLFHKWKKG